MQKIEIFDSAICCSTEVRGPGLELELLRMSTMIARLEALGVRIVRHNLSEKPQAYVNNAVVNATLIQDGVQALPLTLVAGNAVKSGVYPTNEELLEWSGITREEFMVMLVREQMIGGGCCRCGSGCCCDDSGGRCG